MKKLIILVVSLLLSGLVFAHSSDQGTFGRDGNKNWQQMDRWRDMMHGISVNSDDVTDGVLLKVTADSDEILKNLKTDLQVNEKELMAYFKGVEVQLTETEKGFELNFRSDKVVTVKKLQNWKNGLLYQYLRDKMHSGFDSRMGFGGHMGGCGGPRQGNGLGMMRGNYDQMGREPGMMGQNNYDPYHIDRDMM